jgi:hypothetical protein
LIANPIVSWRRARFGGPFDPTLRLLFGGLFFEDIGLGHASSRSHPSCQTILMNPKHFHTPVSTRARCPVCHEAVYSRAGIHPQCAVRQSEPPRTKPQQPTAPGLASPGEGAEELAGTEAGTDLPAV